MVVLKWLNSGLETEILYLTNHCGWVIFLYFYFSTITKCCIRKVSLRASLILWDHVDSLFST